MSKAVSDVVSNVKLFKFFRIGGFRCQCLKLAFLTPESACGGTPDTKNYVEKR